MRRATSVVFLLCFGVCRPVGAWHPELHEAIFEAARQISPVVDSRFDETMRMEVLEGIREPDLTDRACLRHRGEPRRAEAWTLAAAALRSLRSPHPSWGPRQKARTVGTYLHYVADCVTPPIATRDRMRTIPSDVAVFRERSPLGEPAETELQRRAAAASARGGGHEVLPTAFRAAVNLSIDAARLLPLAAGVPEPEDVGPVLIVPLIYVTERVNGRPVATERVLHSGLHVLEWSTRRTAAGTVVTALIQNNMDFCVRHVFFRMGSWVGGLTATLPASSLTTVELPGPAGSSLDVVPRFVPGECIAEPGRTHVPTRWLRVAYPDGMAMRFDRIREFKPGVPGPEPFGHAVFVEYREADMESMKGLELPEFQATAQDDRIDLRFRVRNRSEKSPRPLLIDIEVASGARTTTDAVEVKVDLKGLAPGQERSFQGSVPAKTYGELTELRVFRIRREAKPSTSSRQVAW